MASKIDLAALTINPVEQQNISEYIARLITDRPAFNEVFTVFTGFDKKTQLVLNKKLKQSGILDSGSTRPNSGNMGVSFLQKYIQVVNIGDTLEHTQADVDQNWKAISAKYANEFKELGLESEAAKFILGAILESMDDARWRLSMLGDTDQALVADGGNVLPVVDSDPVSLYTPLDGVWKQVFDAVAAELTPRTVIAANTAISKDLQDTLAADACYQALKSVYKKAHPKLKSNPGKKFLATPAMYYNLEDYYSEQPLNGGLTTAIIDGIPVLKYKGIPVIKDELSDELIREQFSIDPATELALATTAANFEVITVDSTAGFPANGKIKIGAGGVGKEFVYTSKTDTTFVGTAQLMAINAIDSAVELVEDLLYIPHRILMFAPDNMGWYTVSEEDFAKIESWYNQDLRVNKMAYIFAMCLLIHREELLSVAY